MPWCPACKAERSGNFCSSCGGRVSDRKVSVSGGTSPTNNGGTSPHAVPSSGSPVMAAQKVRGSGNGTRQSVSSLPDSSSQSGQPLSSSPPPDAPFAAKKANLSTEASQLIQQMHSDKPNSRKRELPVPSIQGMSRITVAVRKRPLNPSETPLDVIAVRSLNSLEVLEGKKSVDGTQLVENHKFVFDEVFDESDTNVVVYQRTARRLMDHIFNGGFCCCFAYGQTGSGKTYTMMGSGTTNLGIYIQAANEIFERIGKQPLSVAVSFYEIYASKLYDLLNNKEQIYSREDENQKVHIRGLTEHIVSDSKGLMELVRKGLDSRSQSTTVMNDESSRSHAIMDIKLKLERSGKLIGKLSVVDLAGSERASVGHSGDKQVQMEGAEINKSLLALKECIRALDQGQRHIPFRQSELTQILKESFLGENGHTMMIANISCSPDSTAETLNTLRYAYRVKELKVDEDSDRKVPQQPARSDGSATARKTSSASTEKKCPGCDTMHKNYAFLEAHKECCEHVTVSCDYCPSSFKRKDFEKHRKTCTKFPVICKLCGEKIPRDVLKKHQNMECPKSETSCLFCRMKLLRDELEAHKGNCDQRQVECDDCGAKVKVALMQAHRRTCKKVKRDSIGGPAPTPAPAAAAAASAPSSTPSSVPTSTPVSEAVPAPVQHSPPQAPLDIASKSKPASPPAQAEREKERPPSAPEKEKTPPSSQPPSARSSTAGESRSTYSDSAPPKTGAYPPRRSKPTSPSNGNGSCALSSAGCPGGSRCNNDSHMALLMSLYKSQVEENASLRQELVSMDARVKRLEQHNDQLRQFHSQISGSKLKAMSEL